ncbi:MAG: Tat pathway signal sequence domain protein [Opitutales bacterium]
MMIPQTPFLSSRLWAVLCLIVVCLPLWAAAEASSVRLNWLEPNDGKVAAGTTLGTAWPMGLVDPASGFRLEDPSGQLPSVAVQSWPLAYWPDGSLKWSGHAVAPEFFEGEGFDLRPVAEAPIEGALRVVESDEVIEIDTGTMRVRVPKGGDRLIRSIDRDGHPSVRNGRLVALRQDQDRAEPGNPLEVAAFQSRIDRVELEQSGPQRAVVRLEGMHVSEEGRAWLPFVVRLYFYAGDASLRMLHTFIYDGDVQEDFIGGLGVRFEVPMRGHLHDRHVRFSGEEKGLWGEAVRGLTGLRRDPGEEVRAAQIAGRATPPLEEWWQRVVDGLERIPAFGDFTLFQPTPDSFAIRKRTAPGHAWLDSAYGGRASGLVYVGSPQGGAAFALRDFWQSHPSQLDVRGATTDAAEVTLWLWAPDAQSMDLRFYHDGMGLDTHEEQLAAMDMTYEDYEPGFGDAKGVARTSELRIWALEATPARERLVKMARTAAAPPQLVARPEDYKAAGVFADALWDLPDRSTPAKAAIEDQLDFYFEHYQREVDQRNWYGFWNYGDVIHSYDRDRHVWRYDIGGFAWANSELSPDIWLWYTFLRTGRADVFRMAEAMTRHTGEVDVYHLGRFAGLGTRHNVQHWGDSAKQLRISTAANRRFFYFITADERTGDLMREVLGAERRLVDVPPGRKLGRPPPDLEGKPYSMMMNLGTDWNAVAAAWLTEWERTGEPEYRDRLLTAMRSIGEMEHGLLSSGTGFNPETGRFYRVGEGLSASHLAMVFGGVEINAELLQLLDVPAYEAAFIQYGRFFNAPREEKEAIVGRPYGRNLNLGQAHSRMTAYAAWKLDDDALAERAWSEFFGAAAGPEVMQKPYPLERIEPPLVLEPLWYTRVSTNGVSQFGLTAIQNLALIGEHAPQTVPENRE